MIYDIDICIELRFEKIHSDTIRRLFYAVSVVSLSLCDANNYLEVKEGQNNTFQCTRLTIQPSVTWSWEPFILSTCTSTSCSNDRYPDFFQFTRTEVTSSNVTVYPGNYENLDYLATTSLSCQQGSAANKVTCQLDVVCKYSLCI